MAINAMTAAGNDVNTLADTNSAQKSFKVLLNGHALSSQWAYSNLGFGLSIQFDNNEIGFNYSSYANNQDEIHTFERVTSGHDIMSGSYNYVSSSSGVEAFSYRQSSLFYARLFPMSSNFTFKLSAGIGLGSGFERKAINHRKSAGEYSKHLFGYSQETNHYWDIEEEAIGVVVFPVGADMVISVYHWLDFSVKAGCNISSEFTDYYFGFGASIYVFQ